MEFDASDPVGETRGTYDLITTEYARQKAAAWPELVDNINDLTASLAPGGVVADVGCGPGRDIALLRAEGFRVVGIDLSFGQLRASSLTARAARPGGELFLGVVEGDGEGFEVASNYGSDRRRWFTKNRAHDLTALLATAEFAVHQIRRDHGLSGWLSIHARRIGEPAACI